MSSRKRKHGIFAVSGDVVVIPTKKNEDQKGCTLILTALETDGSTLKNHKFLKLPIENEMAEMLTMLIKLNERY